MLFTDNILNGVQRCNRREQRDGERCMGEFHGMALDSLDSSNRSEVFVVELLASAWLNRFLPPPLRLFGSEV